MPPVTKPITAWDELEAAHPERPLRVRDAPRISVSKLAEYLDVGPARRRRILEGQKYPPAYVVALYGRARRAICRALIDGVRDPIELSTITRDWWAQEPTSAFAQRERNLSAAAVSDLAIMADDLGLSQIRCTSFTRRPPPIERSGVAISVAPDLALGSMRDAERVGALKLYFSKAHPQSDRQGDIAAALLCECAQRALSDFVVDPALCRVVDVFAGYVYSAEGASERIGKAIAAACKEIAAIWPAI